MFPIIVAAGAVALAGTLLTGCAEPEASPENKTPTEMSPEEYQAHQRNLQNLGVQNPRSPLFGVGTFWRSSHSEFPATPLANRGTDPLRNEDHEIPVPVKASEKGAEALFCPAPLIFCVGEIP